MQRLSPTASHRRRQNERWPASASVSLISAACFLLLLFMTLLSLLAPPLVDHPSFPHSPHRRLKQSHPHLLLTKNIVEDDLWSSTMSNDFYGCSNAGKQFKNADEVTTPDRYLMISANGGLNQQRTGITDAVVAARLLNATLVVPMLDLNSFWKDKSNFSEIYDVDWFISSLSNDVKIIKQLPAEVTKSAKIPYKMRVPRKCTVACYQNRVLPHLMKKHVVKLTKFDYRLSNKLPTDLQKLRCRVNYHALRFENQIQEMGEMLIQRMKAKSKHFIAIHLRFEPDMLAFSGCYYGGGDKERAELGAIRKRWKSLHANNPEKERRRGKCPLTPEELGLMLRALGYNKDVHIYVASGEIYGGEQTLAPLKEFFPNFHSKDTLASKEELAPFSKFSSRMAALDYIVCDGSDVFVTNNNGNMARMLAGRRRYFGHKKTIRPNTRKLDSLFSNQTQATWDVFVSQVRNVQKGFMGEPKEIKPGRGEFHENPQACICEKGAHSGSGNLTKVTDKDDDYNLNSVDGDHDQLDLHELDLPNRTDPDSYLSMRTEDSWEEVFMLSD